ncbi:hypothetical protein HDU78_010515 [Chytriomyces hyalinus]|nr:hypothetical protein HDU78_010515 [Chytriomyces hyalinus]
MAAANELSTSTGRNVANELAVNIQHIEGELALAKIGTLLQYVTENTLGIYKSLQAYVDTDNFDEILYSFANANKFTGYPYNMYVGTYDDAMIVLQQSGPTAILMTTPIGFAEKHPKCKICRDMYQNFTQADMEWSIKLDTYAIAGGWNLESMTYSGFQNANFSFKATRRPWYKLAALQDSKKVSVVYSDPYLFAGGGVGETGGATAGIAVAIPYYDNKDFLRGVYSSDIAFTDMHDTLTKMLHTPNSFIYVMTRNGILIGTSTNESVLDPTGNLKLAVDASHPRIHFTANFLKDKLAVGKTDFSVLEGSFEADDMYFQVRALAQEPRYVIVNGAPKTDYTGDIAAVLTQLDETLKSNVEKIVAISVAVFVIMVLISCILTYFSVTVPLAKITAIMVEVRVGIKHSVFSTNLLTPHSYSKATSFDFTAFKAMEKQKGNFITELGTMEKVFYTMIEKFAQSIKANRELSTGHNNNQTSQSGRNTLSHQGRKT